MAKDSEMPLFDYDHQVTKRQKLTSDHKLNKDSEYWWLSQLAAIYNTEKVALPPFYYKTLSRHLFAFLYSP